MGPSTSCMKRKEKRKIEKPLDNLDVVVVIMNLVLWTNVSSEKGKNTCLCALMLQKASLKTKNKDDQ